jgi:hypothetical protein
MVLFIGRQTDLIKTADRTPRRPRSSRPDVIRRAELAFFVGIPDDTHGQEIVALIMPLP